jgi:hypothetical protein
MLGCLHYSESYLYVGTYKLLAKTKSAMSGECWKLSLQIEVSFYVRDYSTLYVICGLLPFGYNRAGGHQHFGGMAVGCACERREAYGNGEKKRR